jgi:hypothetical protein
VNWPSKKARMSSLRTLLKPSFADFSAERTNEEDLWIGIAERTDQFVEVESDEV